MGIDRLECATDEAESNLRLVQGAISCSCCDRHGSAAALMVIRTGILAGIEASGLRFSEEAAELLRRRYEYLFQKDHLSSDTAAIALLDLLTVVLVLGKVPGDPAIAARAGVA